MSHSSNNGLSGVRISSLMSEEELLLTTRMIYTHYDIHWNNASSEWAKLHGDENNGGAAADEQQRETTKTAKGT